MTTGNLPYPIQIGHESLSQLSAWLETQNFSRLVVLSDDNTHQHCYPRLTGHLPKHDLILIHPGEKYKNLDTCIDLWAQMTDLALDRKALLINLGGGVIGDMGGFVASTYKRGMAFVQIPTTLLSQVDASVGSKLGIDFQGYKNHVGLYQDPLGVYIDPAFLTTLPKAELKSGFAEVIKHHLIADRAAWDQLRLQTEVEALPLEDLIRHSIEIKARIVQADQQEQGLRKALNFGHTIGHALETARLHGPSPLLHGEAIVVGMIAESYLSHQRGLLSLEELRQIEAYFSAIYPEVSIPSQEDEEIYRLSLNDKKNLGGKIMCTLLDGIGQAAVNQEIKQEDIYAALDYYRNLSNRVQP